MRHLIGCRVVFRCISFDNRRIIVSGNFGWGTEENAHDGLVRLVCDLGLVFFSHLASEK